MSSGDEERPLWKRLIEEKPRREPTRIDAVSGCCLGELVFAALCAGVGYYFGGLTGAAIGGGLALLSVPLYFVGGE